MSINTIGSTKVPVSVWNESNYKEEKLPQPGPCGMVAVLAATIHMECENPGFLLWLGPDFYSLAIDGCCDSCQLS